MTFDLDFERESYFHIFFDKKIAYNLKTACHTQSLMHKTNVS